MTEQSQGWRKQPLTPWVLVERRFFKRRTPNAATFAEKYFLDETQVRQVFEGKVTALSPELCAALGLETKMTVAFFLNLSDQYQQRTAA